MSRYRQRNRAMALLRFCLSLTIWLTIILTGCASPPSSPSPSPSPIPPPTPTTQPTPPRLRPIARPTPSLRPPPLTPAIIKITVWENLPPAQTDRLTEEIAAFEATFPAYRVDLQHYETPPDFMAALSGGAEVDVALAAPPLLNRLWGADQIVPMADVFPPSFIDGFAAPTLVGATQGADLWGLPDTVGFHLLLFYNRQLLDTPPTDTDELADLARNLTRGRQQGLGVNSYDPLWLLPWLTPYDGWLTGAAGQPTLDTPAMIAALSLYQGWHTGPEAITPVMTYEEMRQEFVAGRLAMIIDGEWAIDELSQVEDLDWGVTLLPRPAAAENNQPPAPLILARYWVISRTAAGNRASAAAAFVEHVTRPTRQLVWTERFGLLPTRRQALNDPLLVNNARLRASITQMLSGRAVPLGTDVNLLLDAMRDPLRSVVEGELTPEEAAQQMQQGVTDP